VRLTASTGLQQKDIRSNTQRTAWRFVVTVRRDLMLSTKGMLRRTHGARIIDHYFTSNSGATNYFWPRKACR